MSMLSTPREVGLFDHLFGAALALLYTVVLLATASDIGMSRDESFYVHAADEYGAWYRQLYDEPSVAFTRESIDRHWSYNSEHPALVKTLFAWSALWDRNVYPALRGALGLAPRSFFSQPSTAYRLPGMLTAALTVWLIYVIGTSKQSRWA